jgi:hypothetical protein
MRKLLCSIEHTVEREHSAVVGFVGSDLDRAVYQELGTSHIPARSFLMEAAIHKEAVVHQEIAKVMKRAIDGANHATGELGEILHIAREAAHDMKHMFNETVADPSGNNPQNRL